MKNQKKAYIYAISAVLLWSTVSTAFKVSLQYLDFIQLLFFSSFTALIIFFAILYSQNKLHQLKAFTARQYIYSALLGFLNPFLYYMVLLKAYSLLPAQMAQPLNYTWPIMLVLLSALLLKQPLSVKSIVAVLISFTGVYLISSRGNIFSIDTANTFGVILASGSSIIWSLFWIYNVKDKRDEGVKLLLNFAFGTVYIFIAMILLSTFKIQSYKGLLAAAYVGFFEMGITFFFWMKAMQYTQSNDKISNLVFISPFMALIFIHFILGESIYYTTILGLVFIISGIVVQQLKLKNAKAKSYSGH